VEAAQADRNLEAMRRAFDAWNAHDFEALLSQVSPSYEWDMTRLEGWPEDSVYKGEDGLRRLWQTWLEPWDEFRVEASEMIPKDDKVFCHIRMLTRGKGSSVAVGLEYGQVTTFDASARILRNQVFSSITEARAAAGLAD
jgi:ketosteroid isomerase-like protein